MPMAAANFALCKPVNRLIINEANNPFDTHFRRGMEFEEFINQHDGLLMIKEKYELTDEQIKQAFVDGLNSLLQTKMLASKMGT